MFLFDPTFGASWENCENEIKRLMDRIDAEIVFCKKWDERRLAYKIKGCKRGVYVLVYFNADGSRIKELERDTKISEDVLRIMVVCAEGVTPDMMERSCELHGSQPESEGSDDGHSYGASSRPQPAAAPAAATATATAPAPVAESTDEAKPEN
jgi:small subunit ribosomal protein S6